MMFLDTALNEKILKLFKFIILWLPTIIFLLIVFFKTLRGVKRGYRKSMILFVKSSILFLMFVGLYLIICDTIFGDKLLLNIVNIFMGEGGLQGYLGVPETYDTLTKVLLHGLPNNMNLSNELAYALSIAVDGSELYLNVLVNTIYHVLFALVFYVLYLVLSFIVFLIIVIFKSERKAVKKYNKRFIEGKEYNTYKKNGFGGGLIGFARGMVAGLIMLSFTGGFLFILSGDQGSGTLKDCDFGDENVNLIYEMYQTVDSYAEQGAFKVLNYFQDEEKGPVYLFFADEIFSGKAKQVDSETGVVTKLEVNARQQDALITSFAKELINLLSLYAEETVRDYFNGDIDSADLIDRATELLLTNQSFQQDLLLVVQDIPISEFTENLALSIVDSYLKSIDDLNLDGLGELPKEVLCIVFAEGYYSEYIEKEKELLDLGCDIPLPTITTDMIYNKDDLFLMFDMAFSIINQYSDLYEDFDGIEGIEDINTFIPYVKQVIDYVERLSIFSTDKRYVANAVLGRIFNLFKENFLDDEGLLDTGDLIKTAELTYNQKYLEYFNKISYDYDWVGEVEILLDAVSDIAIVVNDIILLDEDDPMVIVSTLFDPKYEKYAEVQGVFDSLCQLIYDSNILGEVLASDSFYKVVNDLLSSFIEGYTLPRDVTYTNIYDENGKLIKAGEFYYLLRGVRFILTHVNMELVEKITTGEFDSIEMIKEITNLLDIEDQALIDYVVSSTILETVFSALLINMNDMDASFIYITKQAIESDEEGKETKIIKKEYMRDLLALIPRLTKDEGEKDSVLSILEPFIEGEELTDVDTYEIIDKVLDSDAVNEILNNRILQGIVGGIVSNLLEENDFVVFPNKLKEDKEAWVTTNTSTSEIVKLKRSLDLLELKFAEILDPERDTVDIVINNLLKLSSDETKLREFFESDIIRYTISKALTSYDFGDSFKLIVPASCREDLKDESIPYVIKNDELVLLLKNFMKLFGLDPNTSEISDLQASLGNVNDILNNVIRNRDEILASTIISASLARTVSNILDTEETSSLSLSIPEKLKIDAETEKLEFYSNRNEWYSELRNFLTCFDEIFGVTDENVKGSVDLTSNKMGETITKLFNNGGFKEESRTTKGKTKLELLYSSKIIGSTITNAIDTYLNDNIIDQDVKKSAFIESEGRYKEDEFLSLFQLLDMFGITDITKASTFDTNKLSESLLDDDFGFNDPMKEFKLVRGVLTKQIEKTYYDVTLNPSGILHYHPLAYDTKGCLKKTEINSILNILKSDKFTNWDPTSFKFDEFLQYIYDENGKTSSYIIVATISNQIVNTEGIIIPIDVLDPSITTDDFIISPKELYSFLTTVVELLGGSFTVSEFGLDKINIQLFDSVILNATICANLKFNNGDIKTYVYDSRVKATRDFKDNKIIYMKEEEYTALCTALLGEELDFSVGMELLNESDQKFQEYLDCSITKIMISDLIIDSGLIDIYNTALSLPFSTITGEEIHDSDMDRMRVYDLSNLYKETHYVLTDEQIQILRSKTSLLPSA